MPSTVTPNAPEYDNTEARYDNAESIKQKCNRENTIISLEVSSPSANHDCIFPTHLPIPPSSNEICDRESLPIPKFLNNQQAERLLKARDMLASIGVCTSSVQDSVTSASENADGSVVKGPMSRGFSLGVSGNGNKVVEGTGMRHSTGSLLEPKKPTTGRLSTPKENKNKRVSELKKKFDTNSAVSQKTSNVPGIRRGKVRELVSKIQSANTKTSYLISQWDSGGVKDSRAPPPRPKKENVERLKQIFEKTSGSASNSRPTTPHPTKTDRKSDTPADETVEKNVVNSAITEQMSSSIEGEIAVEMRDDGCHAAEAHAHENNIPSTSRIVCELDISDLHNLKKYNTPVPSANESKNSSPVKRQVDVDCNIGFQDAMSKRAKIVASDEYFNSPNDSLSDMDVQSPAADSPNENVTKYQEKMVSNVNEEVKKIVESAANLPLLKRPAKSGYRDML